MNTKSIQKQMCWLECMLFFFTLLVVMIGLSSFAIAFDVPSDRRVIWQGNVGVEGGIPIRTNIKNCVTLYGVHADNLDTSAEINECLNSIGNEDVAYLPPGTYIVTSTIKIPSNKTLRGGGQQYTIILSNADLKEIVKIGNSYTDTSGVNIVSGYTKGSTQLVLSNASSISAGDFIYIDELNDLTIPVDINGDGGPCTYCGRYGTNGTRARLQIVKVVGKSGNTIDITPPLFFSLSSGNSPLATKTVTYTQYAGIEDLTVKNGSGTWISTRKNILMQGAANCWVKNVKIDTCGKRCIDLWFDNYRNEIRDNLITGCNNQYDSDTCYGVHIDAGSSNLVENNIFYGTANGVVLVSASGNVIAYNYTSGVHRTQNMASWMWPDTWTHGSHNTMNLWEGNDIVAINWDYVHGSGSHNTVFRNRFSGKDSTLTYNDPIQEVASIITERNNHYVNIIGNVVGSPGFHSAYEVKNISRGWTVKAIYATGILGDNNSFNTMLRHMNFDYYTNTTKYCNDSGEPGCQGTISDQYLPASLYLTSKPSWWGNKQWPPIGPDVAGYVTNIPARVRFNSPVSPLLNPQ